MLQDRAHPVGAMGSQNVKALSGLPDSSCHQQRKSVGGARDVESSASTVTIVGGSYPTDRQSPEAAQAQLIIMTASEDMPLLCILQDSCISPAEVF